MVARRFEDLIAWQKARIVVQQVYQLTRLRSFREDASLVDQMRRSAVSVMSNIAEGFERESRPEFVQFLKVARGSAGELRSQLYVVADCGFADEANLVPVRALVDELCRVLAGLRRSILRNPRPQPAPPIVEH